MLLSPPRESRRRGVEATSTKFKTTKNDLVEAPLSLSLSLSLRLSPSQSLCCSIKYMSTSMLHACICIKIYRKYIKYVCTYIYTHVFYTCIDTYIYTYTHLQTQVCMPTPGSRRHSREAGVQRALQLRGAIGT